MTTTDKFIHCDYCNGNGLSPVNGFDSCPACHGAGGLHNPKLFERKDSEPCVKPGE